MSDDCIIIPTYNESENIANLIKTLEKEMKRDFNIIIVDDNSPDGTAKIAQSLNDMYGNIIVCQRQGKLGIGSAIIAGMKVALSFNNFKYIATMDADFSHDPVDVVRLFDIAEKRNFDLIQGSRYIKGGKIVGWGFYRKIQSYTANRLAKLLLGLPTQEVTTYLRVYSRKCAEAVVSGVHSNRYEFAIDSALIIKDSNFSVHEVPPITFVDRTLGNSKLKKSDVLGWLYFVIKKSVYRTI